MTRLPVVSEPIGPWFLPRSLTSAGSRPVLYPHWSLHLMKMVLILRLFLLATSTNCSIWALLIEIQYILDIDIRVAVQRYDICTSRATSNNTSSLGVEMTAMIVTARLLLLVWEQKSQVAQYEAGKRNLKRTGPIRLHTGFLNASSAAQWDRLR